MVPKRCRSCCRTALRPREAGRARGDIGVDEIVGEERVEVIFLVLATKMFEPQAGIKPPVAMRLQSAHNTMGSSTAKSALKSQVGLSQWRDRPSSSAGERLSTAGVPEIIPHLHHTSIEGRRGGGEEGRMRKNTSHHFATTSLFTPYINLPSPWLTLRSSASLCRRTVPLSRTSWSRDLS